MLTEEKHAILKSLIDTSSPDELKWIKEYLSSLISDKNIITLNAGANASVKKLTIVYGTETGNSKKLATDFASKAKKKQIQTKLVSLDQYRLNDLEKE